MDREQGPAQKPKLRNGQLMRFCHICKSEVADHEWCSTCQKNFDERRDADTMSLEERIEELKQIAVVPFEIPLSKVHQRLEELMQRPVWVHELGDPNALCMELTTGKRTGMAALVEKIRELQDEEA